MAAVREAPKEQKGSQLQKCSEPHKIQSKLLLKTQSLLPRSFGSPERGDPPRPRTPREQQLSEGVHEYRFRFDQASYHRYLRW